MLKRDAQLRKVDLPQLLREQFGDLLFLGISDQTPMGAFLLKLEEAHEQESELETEIGICEAFCMLECSIRRYNAENSKASFFNGSNNSLVYEEDIDQLSLEERDEILRTYIRCRYDYFFESTISNLEIRIIECIVKTDYRYSFVSRIEKCPYYEPALRELRKKRFLYKALLAEMCFSNNTGNCFVAFSEEIFGRRSRS
jgi:hypothetical protein